MPVSSEAHVRASIKWAKKRDSITIRPTKAEGEAIRAAAQSAGKGLQEYIMSAVRKQMEQDAEQKNN